MELFNNHPNFIIQKDIDNSSWFGFSLVIKSNSKLKRKNVVNKLRENKIECRSIVAGNFTKNQVIKYFDYEIHNKLVNADLIHNNGFFVGNHHFDIQDKIEYLYNILGDV